MHVCLNNLSLLAAVICTLSSMAHAKDGHSKSGSTCSKVPLLSN